MNELLIICLLGIGLFEANVTQNKCGLLLTVRPRSKLEASQVSLVINQLNAKILVL